jgi:hypothetical protein
MKFNETKSTHVTFVTRRATFPPVKINDVQLPQSDEVKYLGLNFDGINTFSPRGNNSALPSQKFIGCSDEGPNSPPPTNYYPIKTISNPSGSTVYNCGELLPPQTLKFWKDSNLRSCASLWTPHDTSLIHSSERTSADLQSKKKSAVTGLTMVFDFAPFPIIWP